MTSPVKKYWIISSLLLITLFFLLFQKYSFKSLFSSNLSALNLLKGNKETSIVLANKAINTKKASSAAYYNLYIQKNDLYHLIQAYRLAPNNFTYLSKLAEDSIEKGKWYESQRYFNSLKLARYLSGRGLEFAYSNDKNISKKGLFYLCFARKISNDSIVSSALGRVLSSKYNSINKARILFEESIKNDIKNPIYYSDLANIEYRKKNYISARSYYIITYRLDPNNYWCLINISNTYRVEKNFTEAIKWLEKAKNLDAEIETAYYNSARIYEEIGNYDLADNEYRELIEKRSYDYSPRYNWGIYLYNRKDYLKAINQLTMSIIFKDDFVWSYFYRSRVYEKIENFTKAIKDMEKCIQLDSANISFKNKLDDLKSKINNTSH